MVTRLSNSVSLQIVFDSVSESSEADQNSVCFDVLFPLRKAHLKSLLKYYSVLMQQKTLSSYKPFELYQQFSSGKFSRISCSQCDYSKSLQTAIQIQTPLFTIMCVWIHLCQTIACLKGVGGLQMAFSLKECDNCRVCRRTV